MQNNDLIFRAAAIKEIASIRYCGDFISALIHLPAVDAVPVVHGWWTDKGSLSCRCSRCGCKSSNEYKYCPNCGAKMDGGDDNAPD